MSPAELLAQARFYHVTKHAKEPATELASRVAQRLFSKAPVLEQEMKGHICRVPLPALHSLLDTDITKLHEILKLLDLPLNSGDSKMSCVVRIHRYVCQAQSTKRVTQTGLRNLDRAEVETCASIVGLPIAGTKSNLAQQAHKSFRNSSDVWAQMRVLKTITVSVTSQGVKDPVDATQSEMVDRRDAGTLPRQLVLESKGFKKENSDKNEEIAVVNAQEEIIDLHMNKSQLAEEARSLGLPWSGTKTKVLERIQQYLRESKGFTKENSDKDEEIAVVNDQEEIINLHMNKSQLAEKARSLGLPWNGTKTKVLERIQQYLRDSKVSVEVLPTKHKDNEEAADIHTLNATQLADKARLLGLTPKGNKSEVLERIQKRILEFANASRPKSIVAIDCGMQNIGFVHVELPTQNDIHHETTPTILDWGVLGLNADNNDLSTMARECKRVLDERLLKPSASLYIIERQSWRVVHGKLSIPPQILASRMVEGMLLAMLNDRREGSTVVMSPQSVSHKWNLQDQKTKKIRRTLGDEVTPAIPRRKKITAVRVVRGLLTSNQVNCPTQLKQGFLDAKKKDDMSDAMLTALTWVSQWDATKKEADVARALKAAWFVSSRSFDGVNKRSADPVHNSTVLANEEANRIRTEAESADWPVAPRGPVLPM
ncbi:hypothetical protein DFJ77DRAFT_513965 [Powellomyces hirtus]|nr:hypothetical protein DFJ77DRAFT_513965 [Powellomyces hirtus]